MHISMDTFDLTGMDAGSAQEVVAHIIRSLVETKIQRKKLDDELAVWKARVRLASEKGRSDLEAQAKERVLDIETRRATIQTEEQELTRVVEHASGQLTLIKSQVDHSINAEALLTQLSSLVGEKDELAEKFQEEEANALLEELKKEIREES